MSIEILSIEPITSILSDNESNELYTIIQYLQTKAYEELNTNSKSRWQQWNPLKAHENHIDLRNVLTHMVFNDIEEKCIELDNMSESDKLQLKAISQELLPRPIEVFEESQVKLIKRWEHIRVEAVFWIIGYSKDGIVFAYLGDNEKDECIFIVKRLATPTPFSINSYNQLDLPYASVQTTLLPWRNDCIIYSGIITPYIHYTPKEHIERSERLTDIVLRCSEKGKIRTSLTINDNIIVERIRIGEGNTANNLLILSSFMKQSINRLAPSSTASEVVINFYLWTPYKNMSHKCSIEELRAIQVEGKTDGFTTCITQSVMLYCGEQCRLCSNGNIFGVCDCKDKHDSKSLKYCLDGIALEDANQFSHLDTNTMKISCMDFYSFKFKVSHNDFVEIQDRLLDCNLFFSAHKVKSEISSFFIMLVLFE